MDSQADIQKTYVSSADMLKLSFLLGRRVAQLPQGVDYVVGIWRGGTAPGIAVHEYLEKIAGQRVDHFPIQTRAYEGIGSGNIGDVLVNPTQAMRDVSAGKHLLLVDDVWDTGRSIEAVHQYIDSLRAMVSTAVLFYKPLKNQMCSQPTKYVLANDSWLVFPHELEGVPRYDVRYKETEHLAGVGLEEVIYDDEPSLRRKLEPVDGLGRWWFQDMRE